MKKCFFRRVWLFFLVLTIFYLTQVQICYASENERPSDVDASSIKYVSSSYDNMFVFKWKKVENATGYQVRLIYRDYYDYDDIAVHFARSWTTKNKIKIKANTPDSEDFYVQIRTFKRDDNLKRVYGNWVTNNTAYTTYIE